MRYNKYKFSIILISILFSRIFSQVDFDGGYIQTQKGKYLKLQEIQCYNLKVNKVSDGFEGHFKTLRSRGEYYIVRNQIRNIVVINKNNFKGIVIKGRYNFDYFSLHPLLEKRVGRGYTIAKNNGPATEYNPYFTPGEKLEVRGKSVDTNSYYWQPRERLPKGEYVAWIGTSFWIFKIE